MLKSPRLGNLVMSVILMAMLVGIPAMSSTVIAQSDSEDDCVNTYMVLDGDTLSGIAKRFQVDMMELAELNNIEDVRLIRIGDVLCLDGLVQARPADGTDDTPPTPLPATPPTNVTPPAIPAVPPSNSILPEGNPNFSVMIDEVTYSTDADSYYVVQEKDRLYFIALAFGLYEEDLIAFNNLGPEGYVYVGQKLAIPAPSPSYSVPGSVAAISILPRLAAPGNTVTVMGYNYPPEVEVELFLEKSSLNKKSDVLRTVMTDENGQFETTVEIPDMWADDSKVESRTISISGYVVDDETKWGMNFLVNATYTQNTVVVQSASGG